MRRRWKVGLASPHLLGLAPVLSAPHFRTYWGASRYARKMNLRYPPTLFTFVVCKIGVAKQP